MRNATTYTNTALSHNNFKEQYHTFLAARHEQNHFAPYHDIIQYISSFPKMAVPDEDHSVQEIQRLFRQGTSALYQSPPRSLPSRAALRIPITLKPQTT